MRKPATAVTLQDIVAELAAQDCELAAAQGELAAGSELPPVLVAMSDLDLLRDLCTADPSDPATPRYFNGVRC